MKQAVIMCGWRLSRKPVSTPLCILRQEVKWSTLSFCCRLREADAVNYSEWLQGRDCCYGNESVDFVVFKVKKKDSSDKYKMKRCISSSGSDLIRTFSQEKYEPPQPVVSLSGGPSRVFSLEARSLCAFAAVASVRRGFFGIPFSNNLWNSPRVMT